MKRIIIGIGVLFVVLVVAQHFFSVRMAKSVDFDGPTLIFKHGPSVSVRLAQTPQEREHGLSGTISLPEGEGMLFFFDTAGFPAFWMKDMTYPIDIIWLSSDWKVVDITHTLPPESYPATVAPQFSTQYVLEVPSGFARTHHITVGQSVSFQK